MADLASGGDGSIRLDMQWARDIAPKVQRAGKLLRELGEYEEAECVLLGALGGSRGGLPGDEVCICVRQRAYFRGGTCQNVFVHT